MSQTIKIFTIYAWEDKNTVQDLLHHMKALKEDFDILVRYDNPIHSEQYWKPQIESRLYDTDIFLFLISADFMKSPFINQIEFKNIIDRYKEDKAVVIPIIMDNCQWDIDFKSDDYNFNFKELLVLPEEGKPITDWKNRDEAYHNIAGNLRMVISSMAGPIVPEEPETASEADTSVSDTEAQLALSFAEKAEAQKEEAKVREEAEAEAEAERKAALEKSKREEAEAKEKAREERKRAETETKQSAEEQHRILAEAEAKNKAEKEKRIREEAEAKKRFEEAEAKKRAEEQIRLKEDAATAKKLEEEKRQKELEEWERNAQATREARRAEQANKGVEGVRPEKNASRKKRIGVGALIVVLAIAAIWAFSHFSEKGSEKMAIPPVMTDTVAVKDSVISEKPAMDSSKKKISISKLAIGDTFEGGIVFETNSSGNIGKIAHSEDAGPMPWKDAMNIHEHLGEGWRLPTLDELKTMYRTIGPGDENSGEFAGDLYWSATPYDANQARLLRFRDGNTSYHYNSTGTHRQFRVRAVRDFSR